MGMSVSLGAHMSYVFAHASMQDAFLAIFVFAGALTRLCGSRCSE